VQYAHVYSHAERWAKLLIPISPPLKFEKCLGSPVPHLSPRNPYVELWQPWHEITSGEELPGKSRKVMSVAIAVRICMEVLAAIAREHILRGSNEARALWKGIV